MSPFWSEELYSLNEISRDKHPGTVGLEALEASKVWSVRGMIPFSWPQFRSVSILTDTEYNVPHIASLKHLSPFHIDKDGDVPEDSPSLNKSAS